MAGDIRELPQDTRDQLRSTFLIQTLPSCLLELVQNALDAQAKNIEVAVSLTGWECRVTDNGTGIDKDSLGLVGTRYYSWLIEVIRKDTSKHGHGRAGASAELYGYRGEALSSIADMSLTEIITRHASSTETYTSIIRGGERFYLGPAKHSHRPVPGTTVIVRDLFYKWPVRRKQAESSPSFLSSTLAQIRRYLEALAIINHNVAFQMYDLDRNDNRTPSSSSLSVPVSASMSHCIANLYNKHLVKNIQHIERQVNNVRIQGFISLQSTHSKQTQFIYINRRCITSSDLHRHINHLFGGSAFARRAEVDARQQDREVSPRPAPFLRDTASPKKQINRYPVFCLSITLPANEVNFATEPNKQVALLQDEAAVTSILKEVVRQFLRKHGFSGDQKDIQSSAENHLSSPLKRLKHARPATNKVKRLEIPDIPSLVDATSPPQNRAHSQAAAEPTDSSGTTPLNEALKSTKSSNNFLSRVGQNNGGSVQLIDSRHLKRSDKESHPGEKPAWLQEALIDWSNPVFPPVQKQIRTVQAGHTARREDSYSERVFDVECSSTINTEMLHWCDFIAQVDLKFLLFSCTADRSTTLLLVDQHAAHERVRVEQFFRNYCKQVHLNNVDKVTLPQPKAILLTAREVLDLSSITARLSQWGFDVTLQASNSLTLDSSFSQVVVKTVPGMVADRLKTDDRLLQTVLRGYLKHSEELGNETRTSRETSWITRMKDMPPVLIDLVNSKACRGAIMFNDEVSSIQARDLMTQLAETDLPFSCAHGRPSMVPLVNLPHLQPLTNERSSIDWKKVGRLLAST